MNDRHMLYDELCGVLTDYEGNGSEDRATATELYGVLVKIQNHWESVITADSENVAITEDDEIAAATFALEQLQKQHEQALATRAKTAATDASTLQAEDISELVGVVTVKNESTINPQLRRDNQIKTIHSSLAIENNSLSLEQMTDVINGKRVLGAPNEIREVKNTY